MTTESLQPKTLPRVSSYRYVWRTPFLRRAIIALFLSGIGISVTTPQMTLYLVDELGASLPVAGSYYLVNLAAPVAGFAIGSLSDRLTNRLTLFRVCAVVGALGFLGLALATRLWMPFVIGAVALSISGGSMAQLFAATRDELSHRPSTMDARIIATVRMAFTGGWIIGPVLGSWLGSVIGLRPLLVFAAVCMASQLIPMGRRRVERYVAPVDQTDDGPPVAHTLRAKVPLLIFTGLCVLTMNGDTIKFAFLPLYMDQQLHTSDAVRGAVIAVQPLLELILMPVFARLAERFSPIRMVMVGALLGTAANLTYATSEHVAGLFVGQLLMSGLWAAMGGLGVNVAQQLYPQGVGLASGVFMSSIMLSGGLGGAIGGLGVAAFGLPQVFFLPAALAGVATVGLFVASRRFVTGGRRRTAPVPGRS